MFVAYGGKDEFNTDAQVESFLYLCKHRGLRVDVAYDPEGRHSWKTAQRLLPTVLEWLGHHLAGLGPIDAAGNASTVTQASGVAAKRD